MADLTLAPEVAELLRSSRIQNNVLILPGRIPDRKLYDAVNRALINAGGTWNRRAGGHVFEGDLQGKLARMLGTGVSIDEKKAFQAFYTPPHVASMIAKEARVDGHAVLEPSAGRGALADACLQAGAQSVQCVEMNPESAAYLRKREYPTWEGDFLQWPAQEHSFPRIVMNPPFRRNQDVAHVAHALKCLRPDGRLVAVMFGNAERKPLQNLLRPLNYTLTHLERGHFSESGTEVPTLVLTVDA